MRFVVSPQHCQKAQLVDDRYWSSHLESGVPQAPQIAEWSMIFSVWFWIGNCNEPF